MSYPKQNTKFIKLKDKKYGRELRKSYSEKILNKEPILPKPLEYEDIDAAFFNFVDNDLLILYDGKKIPSFTLFSNQRFSEYSQMWKYTDENNNLLLNFKTVTRENNPSAGGNQGGLWNIPGERTYKLGVKNVLEENGTESYEIYSMKQPYAVDLMYKIGFVTDKFEMINEFNTILNDKFKARQYYIVPNGHHIPMVIEDIGDETSYAINERKIFVQTFTIKVMAYIIRKDDFKVQKVPKRIKLYTQGEAARKVPMVDIEEYYEENISNKILTLTVNFSSYKAKTEFTIDTDMIITDFNQENIRNIRLFINDTPYYIDKGFTLHNNDHVKIRIRQLNDALPSKIIFNGYDPNTSFDNTYDEDIVSETIEKFKDINIE